MGRYRPTTTDDLSVLAGRREAERRELRDLQKPVLRDGGAAYSISRDGDMIVLKGSDGTETSVRDMNTEYGPATASSEGLMSPSDKAKLDGVESGAQANAVTSVNGKTGAVTTPDTTYKAKSDGDGSLTITGSDGTEDSVTVVPKSAVGSPVGAVLPMSSDAPPDSPGTWGRLTAWHVPMTGVTLYLYERTA